MISCYNACSSYCKMYSVNDHIKADLWSNQKSFFTNKANLFPLPFRWCGATMEWGLGLSGHLNYGYKIGYFVQNVKIIYIYLKKWSFQLPINSKPVYPVILCKLEVEARIKLRS